MLRLSSSAGSGGTKLKEVSQLLKDLQQDLHKPALSNEQRKSKLEQLKVHGREPADAGPIYTEEGISVLAKQAFLANTSIQASREALSCIANSLLLQDQCRQYLANQNIWCQLIDRFRSSETHDQFLVARILFVETYVDSGSLYNKVLEDFPLADVVATTLSQHASRYASDPLSTTSNPMDDNALTEIVKLIFNITKFLPDSASKFSPCIPHLFTIIRHSRQQPPQQPISSVLNGLLNLDSAGTVWSTSCFPARNSNVILLKMTSILNRLVNEHQESELDNMVSPVVALISKIYNSATTDGKKFLQKKLLPSVKDRDEVLGQSKSLSSRLLQLSNSPSVPVLSSAISHLLFELSDNNPETFVENVGLGYASGYLVSQGLPLPGGGQGQGQAGGTNADINPITGQRRDREKAVELPPMTYEEKEREAERLFVLFERLKRTGVVDVRNPVEDAHRFEEVSDD